MVDSPSDGAVAKAPRWDLADTEGCGAGNSFSWCSWMFSGYVDIYRRRKSVKGATRGPRGRGRAHPYWARRPPSWPPRLLLYVHSKSPGLHLFQKDHSRRFHSVWNPFDIPFLRNTEIGKKTAIWAANGVFGQSVQPVLMRTSIPLLHPQPLLLYILDQLLEIAHAN